MASKKAVAELTTESGNSLIIRSYPSAAQVKAFVKEHNRRYRDGEPGGPSGLKAEKIVSALFYPSEEDIGDETKSTKIALSKTIRGD